MNNFICDCVNFQCQTNWERLKVIDAVSNVNTPLVVEIWLYADCVPSSGSDCGDVDLEDDSEADPVLIEVWTFQKILKRFVSDSPSRKMFTSMFSCFIKF